MRRPIYACSHVRSCRYLPLVAGVVALVASHAVAGGGPENLLLIIDPTNAESKYIGNYYKHVRDIPDCNILYMAPGAVDYAAFAATNLDALFGTLANRRIDDHIDYVLIAPGGSFYLSLAPDLIGDGGCTSGEWVRRISMSSAYTLAHRAGEILAGGLTVFDINHQFSDNDAARAFDHDVSWWYGEPSDLPEAQQYFIGFMLGYTGPRGNTVDEIIAMIDRSVAADGTRPAGTFYFMKTTDPARSPPRDPHFANAIAAIQALGGQAEQIDATLPAGRHDCLGVLTGAKSPAIEATDMTLLPGSFCDHLTSYAGKFDTSSQVKMSRWITKGASGSMGTVEEPCVVGAGYTWKFPHPRFHVWYDQGVTLGEALLRSIRRQPFECLFYGDPLTRPFAWIPAVEVRDVTSSGAAPTTVALTPEATTSRSGTAIDHHDLYVDGRLFGTIADGGGFSVNTAAWADGTHEVRVVSYDNTPVATQGRWIGRIDVDHSSREVSVDVTPTSGDLSTVFTATIHAAGGTVAEVRLLHNSRVIAAGASEAEAFDFLGDLVGAGPVRLVAEAEFADGRRAVCEADLVNIDFSVSPRGEQPNRPPVAYSYTKDVPVDAPILLELPASDFESGNLTYSVVSSPARATIEGDGPVRLLRPLPPFEPGVDALTFQADDGALSSNVATVTIRYANLHKDCPAIPGEPCPVPAVPRRGRVALSLALLVAGIAVIRGQMRERCEETTSPAR